MAGAKSVKDQRRAARRAKKRIRRGAKQPKPMKESKSLAFVFLNSAGIAIVGTLGVLLIFRTSIEAGAQVNPEVQSLIVMMSLVIFFLLSLIVLTGKYMPKGWLASQEKRIAAAARGYIPPDEKWGGTLVPKTPRFDKVFDNKWAKHTPATLGDDDAGSTPFDLSASQDADTPEELEAANDGLDVDAETTGTENTDTGEDQTEESETANRTEEPAVSDKMNEVLGHLKLVIVDLTDVLKSLGTKIDSTAKFGLNLYFAGACSQLSRTFKLTADEGRGLLARLMELTGADKQAAHTFASNVNDYGEQPRYRAMIDAGDRTMAHRLKGTEDTGPDLKMLLEEWCNPDADINIPVTHTFMFTDILDTNALTEQLGNMTMQKVVRAHNKCVRDALERFDGHEVKHTGDGIMATFKTPATAVNAAVQIQQNVDLFSREKPELTFEVRIGLHVGEAVEEENDYFGAAVQTTARICAEADAEEIWVSDEIRSAYTEGQDVFVDCGEFALKGIAQAKKLFRVEWSPIPERINQKVDYQEIGRA